MTNLRRITPNDQWIFDGDDLVGVRNPKANGEDLRGLSAAQLESLTDEAAGGIVIDGDSLAARAYNEAGISSASKSGTTATLVLSSFAAPIGSQMIVHGYAESEWNGTKTITGYAAANQPQFTISADAAAVPTTGLHTPSVIAMAQRRSDSPYTWAEFLAGKRYPLRALAARGGRKLAEIASDFDTNAAPYLGLGDVYYLQAGTNDVRASDFSLTSSAASAEQIIAAARARGARVIVGTIPPQDGSENTTARVNNTAALNNALRRLAAAYGARILPVDEICSSAASTSWGPGSGYIDSADSIHLTPTAAKAIGEVLYPMLDASGIGSKHRLPATVSDSTAVFTSATNLLTVGFFAGTGGSTSGSGVSGSVATGWTFTGSPSGGSATMVCSKGTLGGVGASQIITVSANSGVGTLAPSTIHASLEAGATYVMVGKLKSTLSAGIRCTVAATLTQAGVTSLEQRCLFSQSATLLLPANFGTISFESEPFTVPAGAVPTACVPQLVFVLTGATTGDIEAAQFAYRKVS